MVWPIDLKTAVKGRCALSAVGVHVIGSAVPTAQAPRNRACRLRHAYLIASVVDMDSVDDSETTDASATRTFI